MPVEHISEFADIAASISKLSDGKVPLTDKISSHAYETMYGMFILPLRERKVKMLEIGLGCDSRYGAGASAALWAQLLPLAERWEAELDGACVNRMSEQLRSLGIHPLVGDQSDPATLKRWVDESGGKFDVIIDDGGHTNLMINRSFQALWPHLNPGGLYILEDLQVGRAKYKAGFPILADMLHAWSETLIFNRRLEHGFSKKQYNPKEGVIGNTAAKVLVDSNPPMPSDVAFVFVQREAAVVGKLSIGGQRANKLHASIKDDGHSLTVSDVERIRKMLEAYRLDARSSKIDHKIAISH